MKVGFIGCGGFVQGTHLPNVHRNPNLEIHALCDLDAERLACLSKIYLPHYTTKNFLDIAGDKDIEMVVIGTSPDVRVEPIRAMAEAGKHIFVEKPMGLGFADCKKIVDIVTSNGIKLQVGFNRPCSLIMQDTKRIYKKIVKGETLISYRIVGEDILWPEFHQNNVHSGKSNTIIHEITHIFDVLNWLTEVDPIKIYTIGGHSDNNIISITYPNNISAVIISGSSGTEAYPKERMEIYTDNKALIMDSFIELICRRICGEDDRYYPLKTAGNYQDVNMSMAEFLRTRKHWRDHLTSEQIRAGYYYDSRPSEDKGHDAALQLLHDAIVNDTQTIRDERSGAVATLMGLEAINSLRSGHPVSLDLSCFGKHCKKQPFSISCD